MALKRIEKSFSDRQEWLHYRGKGIGASDAPIILGLSKYKKPFELFEIKTGRKEAGEFTNPAIERGIALEPIAREKFAADWNLRNDTDETFEAKNFEMVEHPHMRASLDGISKNGLTIIEIKYQGKENHEAVKRGVVRPDYMAQIQHQLLVSGADEAYLVSIGGDDDSDIHFHRILPDFIYQQEILRACNEFWAAVKAERWAGESLEVSTLELFEKWSDIDAQMKVLEAKKKDLQELIFKSKVENCGPFSVITVVKKGNVDYESVPQLAGVDLEPFRKAPVVYQQIKKAKK